MSSPTTRSKKPLPTEVIVVSLEDEGIIEFQLFFARA